jgi:hypothetical protein
MTEHLERAGARLSRDAVAIEKACTVALIHAERGEETFERYLDLNAGDVLVVARKNMKW